MQRLPQLNTQGPNLVGMFDAGRRMRLADLAEKRQATGEKRADTLHDIAKAGEERAVSGEARKVEKHEQDMAKVQAERMVKGVQRGLKLLQNVKTPEQYQRAMSMYGKMYPELAEQLPVDYDPEALGQQLEWGRSFTELNDKTSPTGKLVADLDKLKPDDPKREIYEKMIAKGMSHGDINYKPDGKGGYVREAQEKKLPPQVKQAQSFVLKFVKTVDPMMAAMIASNPNMANSPIVKQALQSGIPENLRPAYEEALGILNKYYEVENQPGAPSPGGTGAGITHEFVPGKGLVPTAQ